MKFESYRAMKYEDNSDQPDDPAWADDWEEDPDGYCHCNATPTIEELDWNKCDACGKAFT